MIDAVAYVLIRFVMIIGQRIKEHRRYKKYVHIRYDGNRVCGFRVDPRWYTESPKWKRMIADCGRISKGESE